MCGVAKRIRCFLKAGNVFLSHVSFSALYCHSRAFKALFCQSPKAATRGNTQAAVQMSPYLMVVIDSKEKQLLTKQGKQILSPVPWITLVGFSSTVPQTASLYCVNVIQGFLWCHIFLHIFVLVFCAELEKSTFLSNSEDVVCWKEKIILNQGVQSNIIILVFSTCKE